MRADLLARKDRLSGPVAWPIMVLGLFTVLTVVMTYPLVRSPGSSILGPPAPGDNFEYLYKVWWFAHALFEEHVSPFFNPAMFYPFGYNVALSETTLSHTIPALPLTVIWGEVVAYNVMMLASFVLSGLGMYLLVLHLTTSRHAAVLSGTIFAFCPYRLAHLGAGHLPLMGTQWLPFLVLYLDRVVARQRASDAAMAALFYSLGALSAWYYAYMFALAALVYVLLRARPWRQLLGRGALARCAVVFVVVSALLVGPFVLPVTQLWTEGNRPQSLRYVDQFSASPLDFVYPNVMQPLWGESMLRRYPQSPENILYAGLIPLVLTVIAVWRRRDKVSMAFACLSIGFAALAMGTTLHWINAPVYLSVPSWVERLFTSAMGVLTGRLAVFPISSYSLRVEGAIYLPLPTLLLYLFLPFFRAMRVWARFGLVAMLGISVLAGYGLKRLISGGSKRGVVGSVLASQWAGGRSALVTVALLALLIFEFATFPYALGWCSVQARPVDEWLAGQDGDFAIMEFPVISAMSGRSLYAARTHGKPIVFGYGTFFPRAFDEQRGVLESFPSDESLALLKNWNVRYALIRRHSYGDAWAQLERDLPNQLGLRHVITLDDLPIYEGDRLLYLLPGTERAFIVDSIHVFEVL